MPFWQLFYHIVWTTKNREPLLTPDIEAFVYNALRTKAAGLGGVVFALNGMPDHVHLVASVPPNIALARFIGQIKGVASAKLNQSGLASVRFAWQEEYGVFSLDGKRLPPHVAYVENQKQHHTQGSMIPVLERSTGEGVHLVRESSPDYEVDAQAWCAFTSSATIPADLPPSSP
jgi:putative transposase